MERKKILYIVEAMGGGVFTYMREMANGLVSDFDILIAYGMREQTPQNLVNYFDPRVQLIEIQSFCRAISPYKDLKSLCEIKKTAKNYHPDIIHVHSSKAGVLGRLAFNKKGYDLYYTPHGYSFLMQDCTDLKRNLYRGIEYLFGHGNCTTISCSPGENQEAKKITRKTKVVNNGVNIAELNEMIRNTQIHKHPFTAFTIGRICEQKNPDLFNEIALSLPGVHFVWIGDGELKSRLTAPNIEITGWQSREDVIKRAVNGDVFLLTSRWEGLPISLLEGMYMEKVCIVSDVIGNNDVITNGVNGFLCKETAEFTETIKNVSEKDLTSIRRNAKREIKDKYNTRNMIDEYKRIYLKQDEIVDECCNVGCAGTRIG